MNKFFSKCASILLIVMVAALAGCSVEAESKDKNISTLETVLNETFTVPNKELRDILEDPNNYTMIGNDENTSSSSDLDSYLKKKYQESFTEEMYDKYTGTYALIYIAASPENSEMKIKDVQVAQKEKQQNIYDYTAIIDYKKDDGSPIEKYEVKGQVNFSESGKIVAFIIDEDSNLSRDIRNN
ncbi:hypothetical protein ABW02_01200 [Niallia circulans]|uniref:Uncharacterized protein n=1 Tax=Niallia circulans TaxID=1397 RepID=A0A0J1IR09_NIACI|nr:hypothetical protein [Niallia circulans]KLV28391.1 hypothetical protein ABW02_01200 [Niallia circulans]MED5101868.1 hypothetical protein [Niallia circulans]